jgi:hypothetical protein
MSDKTELNSQFSAITEVPPVPFIGILGVSEIIRAVGDVLMKEALARAAPTLSQKDADCMRAIFANKSGSNVSLMNREAYDACRTDQLAQLQDLSIDTIPTPLPLTTMPMPLTPTTKPMPLPLQTKICGARRYHGTAMRTLHRLSRPFDCPW